MTMLKSDIKERWATALESGEYRQGFGRLKSADGYCCLGVLCDLYAKETGTEWTHTIIDDNYPVYEFLGRPGALPAEVEEWAFERTALEDMEKVEGFEIKLIAMNDSGTRHFNQIAQHIREEG